MRIIITGAAGMLGTDLVDVLCINHEVLALSKHTPNKTSARFVEVNLVDKDRVNSIVHDFKPQLIFHCAAMTDVDGCESKHSEALSGNFEITKNVVQAANSVKSGVVLFSTDYVFDGTKRSEYTENDLPTPLNFYGETKLLAEKFVIQNALYGVVFRVSWLFGLHGRSFPRTLLEKSKSLSNFDVVNDQLGRPTYTKDLAKVISQLLEQKADFFQKFAKQIFHLGNIGFTSWYEYAKFIFQIAKRGDVVVNPIETTLGVRPALRPKHSILCLDKSQKLLGVKMRVWSEAVTEFVNEFISHEREHVSSYAS